MNSPVQARNCIPTSSTPKRGKKRKLEEKTGGALAAAASTSVGGELAPPPKLDWIQPLLESNPGIRILQRLSVIFGDVGELQAVVGSFSSGFF